MRFLSVLFAALAFTVLSARADDSGAAPAAPVAPAPVEQAAPPAPVAKKPEEDNEPGAMKRRLQAVAAVMTGRHADPAALEDKTAEVTRLTASLADKDKEIARLNALLVSERAEAVTHFQDYLSGKIKIADQAPSPLAQSLLNAHQNSVNGAIRKVGIAQEALEAPVIEKPAAVSDPARKEQVQAAACRQAWEGAGYVFPGSN